MGAWDVLSRREDDHLYLLSSELKHLNIGFATTIALVTLMVTMPVAGAVSKKLIPMIIEVTSVNERIMRRRIRHSLGVISLVLFPWSWYML